MWLRRMLEAVVVVRAGHRCTNSSFRAGAREEFARSVGAVVAKIRPGGP